MSVGVSLSLFLCVYEGEREREREREREMVRVTLSVCLCMDRGCVNDGFVKRVCMYWVCQNSCECVSLSVSAFVYVSVRDVRERSLGVFVSV